MSRRKLTEEAVAHIRRREMSRREYARFYGVSFYTVRDCWDGVTYRPDSRFKHQPERRA